MELTPPPFIRNVRVYNIYTDGNYLRNVTFSFFLRDVAPLFPYGEEREHRVLNDMRRNVFIDEKKKKVVLGGAISEFNLDSMNNLNNGGGGVLRKFLAL